MITFFTTYLGGTHGTAKSARDFLRALLSCHDSVRVISPAQEIFPSRMCDRDLCTPEWIDMPIGIRLSFSLRNLRLNNLAEWLKDKLAFYRLRHQQSSDIVIVNGWASYRKWCLVEKFFKGTKVIIIRESPRHFCGPDRSALPPDLLGGFASFDHLIFVSERVSCEWRQHSEIACKTYSVLPNCCEEEEVLCYAALDRDRVRAQLGFLPMDFVLLCPGTIEHRKGQDLLLNAAVKLHASIPNLRILLVGNPATQWGDDLLRSIPGVMLGHVIMHLNAKPSIMDLLYAADILVFPSRAEALPRTILEAMVMKTPVVASDVDGIPELVVNEETGLLIPSDDKEGLLSGILRLHAEPKLRRQLSEAGFERYWEHFSRRHQFDKMVNVLETISSISSGDSKCYEQH